MLYRIRSSSDLRHFTVLTFLSDPISDGMRPVSLFLSENIRLSRETIKRLVCYDNCLIKVMSYYC